MRIDLSDGSFIEISDAVILQDPQWRERLRRYLSERSSAMAARRDREVRS